MKVQVGSTTVEIKVSAILSAPRLGFTANFFGWAQALMPLGIKPTVGTGAFWGQVLTNCMEQFEDESQYLLCMDYDAFFSQQDVEALMAMAMTFQCDALTGLMVKREDGRPMLTLLDTLKNPPASGSTTINREWFNEPVQEVDSAHFGCTVISTAALRRAKKPWFHDAPNSLGSWGDRPAGLAADAEFKPRIDPDIWFWRNWRESGNRVFVTPRVTIGHGEYVAVWPSKNFTAPVFQYITAYTKDSKAPAEAWSIE